MAQHQSFPLAKMDLTMGLFTAVVLLLPVGFALGAFLGHKRPILAGTAVFLGLLYAFVWVYSRPTRFELDERALTIVWPIRQRAVPIASIQSAEVLSRQDLRARFGIAARIGVGGLWGAFGWLWTKRMGILHMYVSRIDQLVLIHRSDAPPLLISPANPEAFVRALSADRGPGGPKGS